MAKVYMPLLSAQASGKLANAMVHFYWKGRNVVRQWVIPTNPRDVDQKLVRQKLAGIGKVLGAIETPGATLAGGSTIYQLMVAATPANMIWNAYLVKKSLEDLKTDATFTALSAAIAGTATITCWTESAIALGLADLTGPQYATTITPELQLAMGAYAAYKLALSGLTDIYSTYPSNWGVAEIEDFARELTAAT